MTPVQRPDAGNTHSEAKVRKRSTVATTENGATETKTNILADFVNER